MYGLETLIKMNSGIQDPELPGHRLRYHPRVYTLYRQIASLPVTLEYRCWLFRSLNLYADHVVARPVYAPDEGWDDLEALQQVTLEDAVAHANDLWRAKTMSQPSQKLSTDSTEQLPLLERMARAHDERLRASGVMVEVMSTANPSSPSNQFVATFIPAPRKSETTPR